MSARAEDLWSPSGVASLEPTAEEAVRSAESLLVVAGPGAGKTELLAQRASFLLETTRCAAPKRILAISFKRDAASNLKERVEKRCPDHVGRFDSSTLDAFAKRLVDRFLFGLPEEWRPKPGYKPRLAKVRRDAAVDWLLGAPLPTNFGSRPPVRSWNRERVQRAIDKVMHGVRLPYDGDGVAPILRLWGCTWWKEQLALSTDTPSLSFPMLSRLAAFLLRENPKLTRAVRATYGFVFLDEFQDTTESQWDLIQAAFFGGNTVLTAVGDSRQRIMVWAGAKADIFQAYEESFGARRVSLLRNYRSGSELVRMQHTIAEAVEEGAVRSVAASQGEADGECSVLEFCDEKQEGAYLANLLASELASGETDPRDYCVIVRQRSGEMVTTLCEKLQERGVKVRDESALQDLLVEPLTGIVTHATRLGTCDRDGEAWTSLVGAMELLTGFDVATEGHRLEQLALAHKTCVQHTFSEGKVAELPRRLVEVVGTERYRSTYPQYSDGNNLDRLMGALGDKLAEGFAAVDDPAKLVDELLGVDVVPAMSIHKSKGLEFRTVIFLGLEDAQWWNFRQQPDEEKRAFFVAFSRAVERVLFTFCDRRDGSPGRRIGVDPLHEILRDAGVMTVDCRGHHIPEQAQRA